MDPFKGQSSNPIMFKFRDQNGMINSIKSFRKVKKNSSCVFIRSNRPSHFVYEIGYRYNLPNNITSWVLEIGQRLLLRVRFCSSRCSARTKSQSLGLQLKESKCKELRVDFSKSSGIFQPILIKNKSIDVVASIKLLGLTIDADLKWNEHVMDICKKVSSRLYFLKQLKRAKFHLKSLFCSIQHAFARSESTRVRCYDPLPQYLSYEIEKLQKRAFRIIFPNHIIKKF